MSEVKLHRLQACLDAGEVYMEALRTPDIELLKRFKSKADSMELKAIEFLDRAGNYPRDRRRYTAIRCTFHDGTVITLPRRLEKHFNKQVFMLRPTRDHS